MRDLKIIQIMPAGGWRAEFTNGKKRETLPLVGWALVEDEDGQLVVGLCTAKEQAYADLCTTSQNFSGYIPPKKSQ